jgi:hypothetical protein
MANIYDGDDGIDKETRKSNLGNHFSECFHLLKKVIN